jgi:hypothetical protein
MNREGRKDRKGFLNAPFAQMVFLALFAFLAVQKERLRWRR